MNNSNSKGTSNGQQPLSLERAELAGLVRGLLHELANAITVVEGAAFALNDPLDDELRREIGDDLASTSVDLQLLLQRTRACARARALQPAEYRIDALLAAASVDADLPAPALSCDQGAETVFGDQQALTMMLAELLRNAHEACYDSANVNAGVVARIQVSARRCDRSGQLSLAVSDSGPGMPAEVIAKACVPFFSTRQRPGAGMGLAAARGIVEQHGGMLQVVSSDSGTVVSADLPPAPASSTAPAA